jgi:lipid II isoglutaminyl synthase (glutamine-hydrolysing)
MKKIHTSPIVVGKVLRHASRLRGGSGSALPGLLVEKMYPSFLADMLMQLPDGVVVVTGTNGKTTTTKIISGALEAMGKKVLTNQTGSNFTRGIISTVISHVSLGGKLDFDIAVLELDEAYAAQFIKVHKPRYVLALNVMRDQLDRFGEIDATARLIETVLKSATNGVVVNADDPLLVSSAQNISAPAFYYGVDETLREHFPTDDELLKKGANGETKNTKLPLVVKLRAFSSNTPTYLVDNKAWVEKFEISGGYNYQNVAGAFALLKLLVPGESNEVILQNLSKVKPAFGRGEIITYKDKLIQIVLVKNPSGFRQGLLSFEPNEDTLIAINDDYADGRDVSWLWDVDFSSLKEHSVSMVTGSRAFDMALRLRYDLVTAQTIEPDITSAVNTFVKESKQSSLRVYATYTAMLKIRSVLKGSRDLGERS